MANIIEEKLLNNKNVEKSIKEALQDEMDEARKEDEEVTITDFKKVPPNKIFSNYTVFSCFNRKQKTFCELTGAQVRTLVGSTSIYTKQILNKIDDGFQTDEYVVKFVEYKV